MPPGKADILISANDEHGDFLILSPATTVKNVLISGAK
jgi:hypothetical protein